LWRIELSVSGHGTDLWQDTINIKTSNKESPLLEVPIKITEMPRVRIKPTLVVLRRRADHTAPSAQVEITAYGSTPVSIVNVRKPDWIELDIEPYADNSTAKLYLTLTEMYHTINPSGSGKIVLELAEGLGEVTISVIVIAAPANVVSQLRGKLDAILDDSQSWQSCISVSADAGFVYRKCCGRCNRHPAEAFCGKLHCDLC
jgi:hypothetical protein